MSNQNWREYVTDEQYAAITAEIEVAKKEALLKGLELGAGAMPGEAEDDGSMRGNIAKAWNDGRAETLSRIEALKKEVMEGRK